MILFEATFRQIPRREAKLYKSIPSNAVLLMNLKNFSRLKLNCINYQYFETYGNNYC